MTATAYPNNPQLTALYVGYRQAEHIADIVAPRSPVLTKAFDYTKYGVGDEFTAPDTLVGRTSAPNQVEFGGTKLQAAVADYGLDAPVTQDEIDQFDKAKAAGLAVGLSPLVRATMLVKKSVDNRREKRVADIVFNANNYGVNNKQTLSGTGQWSDFANSDPLAYLLRKFDTLLMRPNLGVIGREVATELQLHPKVISTIYGAASTQGMASLDDIARKLGLRKLVVGDARVNVAKPGQAASMARCWGKHASFVYQEEEATIDGGGMAFCLTAQYGTPVAWDTFDKTIGLRGGRMVRAGESVVELVTANDLGFLVTNAVA